MTDTAEPGFGLGLSEAEKDDLESLMRAVREESAVPGVRSHDELDGRWRELNLRVGRLAAVVLQMDEKVKVLQEIARLSHQKSELMERYFERAARPMSGEPEGRTPS